MLNHRNLHIKRVMTLIVLPAVIVIEGITIDGAIAPSRPSDR